MLGLSLRINRSAAKAGLDPGDLRRIVQISLASTGALDVERFFAASAALGLTTAALLDVLRDLSASLSLSVDAIGALDSVFSPAALFANSEPGVWYDPFDLTTLFQDRAGTTPVTATGQSVGYVLDKSGRGFHMVAPSDASRGTYNVDSNGKAFIALDGADDWYSTSTITPGTDKVQVFAGVRKLSDANNGFIAMMGANSSGNGSFYLAHTGAGIDDYTFRSTGTSSVTVSPTGYAAPITNVVTGLADIAGRSVIVRVDGVQAAQSTTNQGTGNYLANVLYIGQRGDGSSTRRFNGRIYQLIVRFGPNLDAATIGQVEQFVAGRTGVTL